jgi:hypothetical protein
LLEVFLRTVWSIALSNRLVATFLALHALAIDQSLIRPEFPAGHSHGMRPSALPMRYRSVNFGMPVAPSLSRAAYWSS